MTFLWFNSLSNWTAFHRGTWPQYTMDHSIQQFLCKRTWISQFLLSVWEHSPRHFYYTQLNDTTCETRPSTQNSLSLLSGFIYVPISATTHFAPLKLVQILDLFPLPRCSGFEIDVHSTNFWACVPSNIRVALVCTAHGHTLATFLKLDDRRRLIVVRALDDRDVESSQQTMADPNQLSTTSQVGLEMEVRRQRPRTSLHQVRQQTSRKSERLWHAVQSECIYVGLLGMSGRKRRCCWFASREGDSSEQKEDVGGAGWRSSDAFARRCSFQSRGSHQETTCQAS